MNATPDAGKSLSRDDMGMVSVVLPTYNRAPLLGHAITNVLSQVYENLELIVVDDCSTDDTQSVVESFDDPRLIYVRNPVNLKLPASLNAGFDRARGEYLTWTSDDNLYEPDALQRMVLALREEQCDFVYADYYEFNDLDPATGRPLQRRHWKLPDTRPVEEGNRVGACFLYTRRAYAEVGQYDVDLFLVEDYDYFMRISRHFRMHHIARPLYNFRRHDASLYLSRFCEVKAADLLVRYRNGFLDESAALRVSVDLVMRNIERLRNPLLRYGYVALQRTSYRLTARYRSMMKRYLAARLEGDLYRILRLFGSGQVPFREAKSMLETVLKRIAVIQYT